MGIFPTSPFALFAAALFSCLVQNCFGQEAMTEDEVVKSLLSNYSVNARPSSGIRSHPVQVKISFYDWDVFAMDNSMRCLGVQLNVRQKWRDLRLSHPESRFQYLSLRDPKKIWIPDAIFANSRRGHFNDIMEPNLKIKISSDGDVFYTRSVTLELRCETNGSMFPFNQVYCPIVIELYDSNTEEVFLVWDVDPVQVRKDLNFPSYRIALQDLTTCTSKRFRRYSSCLRRNFVLELHHGSVFYLLYLPPLVLVLMGWMSFFLQSRNCKVRLPLLLVTLVLGSLCCGHSSWQSPDRLVMTAADVWSGICMAFVLYALVHFLMTRYVHRVATACGYDVVKQQGLRPTCHESAMQPMMTEGIGKKLQTTKQRCRHLWSRSGNRADIIARMLYPTGFIVANIVYWSVYNRG